jgi:hypothetical protein
MMSASPATIAATAMDDRDTAITVFDRDEPVGEPIRMLFWLNLKLVYPCSAEQFPLNADGKRVVSVFTFQKTDNARAFSQAILLLSGIVAAQPSLPPSQATASASELQRNEADSRRAPVFESSAAAL